MEITLTFFTHIKLLLGLMIGMTAFKVANCKPFKSDGEQFSWKIFFEGCLRQLIVMIGCMAVFMAGVECGDELLLVQINSSKLTVQGAIDVSILIVDSYYAVKFINNLLIFFGVKDVKATSVYDDTSTSCSSSCSCNHGKLIGYIYSASDNCSSEGVSISPVDVDTLMSDAGYDSVDGGTDSDGVSTSSGGEAK